MKKILIFLLVIVCSALLMQGCSGNSGGGSSQSATAEEPPAEPPPLEPPPPPVGLLGDLIDLGDLVYPQGDHWYFTWARAIDDEGTVIGQSNRGFPIRAAFKWEPGSGIMTFLGIHTGVYQDFYGQEVVFEDKQNSPLIYSQAADINATGTIVGYSSTGFGWPDDINKRAFLWDNGDFIDLPPIPGWFRFLVGESWEATCNINSYSEAVDINNNGVVILTLDDNTTLLGDPEFEDPEIAIIGGRHAYYWDGETYINRDLCRNDGSSVTISVPDYKPLGGILGKRSEAVAVNENDQAIVNSGDTVIFHDLNWDVMEVLNELPCDCIAVGRDINDSGYVNNDGIPDGHVIGNSGCFNRKWLEGILNYTFLTLPEINISGEDCKGPTLDCYSTRYVKKIMGFFWDGGSMYPVGHLGGGRSVAADINDKDQVVGGALTADGKTHAFLWTLGPDEKGVIQDLGTLGGDNSFALAINEAGQIVGWAETGEFYNEQASARPVRHAFLWEDGQMYDLGVHDYFYDYPFTPPYPVSYAVDINEQGILNALTGNSVTRNMHSRGFFLSPEMP